MIQGQEVNFGNIGTAIGDGELTKEIEKLQSEKNAQEILVTDGLSDNVSNNPIRFMMLNVQEETGTEMSVTTLQQKAK